MIDWKELDDSEKRSKVRFGIGLGFDRELSVKAMFS
jgi:hypothetical protein